MGRIRLLPLSLLSSLLIVCLAGCGSNGDSTSSSFSTVGSDGGTTSSTVAPPDSSSGGSTIPTGVAKLSWNVPTNADGTPLAGIAGFKVYYGTSPGTYSSSVNVGMTSSYEVSGLAPGTYYFTVTTCDSSGNESGFSNEASKTIG